MERMGVSTSLKQCILPSSCSSEIELLNFVGCLPACLPACLSIWGFLFAQYPLHVDSFIFCCICALVCWLCVLLWRADYLPRVCQCDRPSECLVICRLACLSTCLFLLTRLSACSSFCVPIRC